MDEATRISLKDQFNSLLVRAIEGRRGGMALMRVLEELDFYNSPASAKHHLNVPGGLVMHSLNVARAALELCDKMPQFAKCNKGAVLTAALLHDVCKAGQYIKKPDGSYRYEDSHLMGHGEASVSISITVDPQVQALMKLVKAEIEKHNAAADAHAATITAAVSAAVKNLSESGEILNEEQVKALIKEQVDGGTGGYYGSYELTLAADGWKPARSEDDYENAGGMDYYQCIYDAELSDSTSELVPVGVVSPGSFYTTTKAGVLNGCETHDGFIRFFAQRIPEADIQATVTLFGKGGGSGETGSVSIGQGLKRDASGAIAVRIGEGLDFDSANALTVRKETVMTSEDLLDEEETQQEIVDMLK